MEGEKKISKIRGTLIGAALGDALASATDGKSFEEIVELYGGEIRDFVKPAYGTQAYGRRAGQVTDAFSILQFLVDEICNSEGQISTDIARIALKKWGETEYFDRFAGMTTKKVINAMNRSENNDFWLNAGHLGNKLFKGHYYALSSNGSACKAIAAGIFNPGDYKNAITDSAKITISSHDDWRSVSGGAAVAAAISECFAPSGDFYEVVKKLQQGALDGEKIGKSIDGIYDYPGPSSYKRLLLAEQIAIEYKDKEVALKKLKDIIGSGPEVSETIAMVEGLLLINRNNPLETLYDAVNIGDESCAISEITGAVLGAFYGDKLFPDNLIKSLKDENDIDFENIVLRITERI